MNAQHPGEVTPEDLLAYVDGDAPRHVVEHVHACASCAAEARAYAQAERALRRGLFRFDCPSPQTLGEYQLGLVSPEDRVSIAAHLLGCPRCADELRTLRSFLAADAFGPAPPVGAVERLRRVVATLVAPQPGLAYSGLRGAAETPARTYRAGDVTLTLGVMPETRRGKSLLVGLLMREELGREAGVAGEAHLVSDAGTAREADVDDLGNFTFGEVASGTYRLEVRLSDQVIVVEDVRIDS